jgi:hypothetical protein
MHHPLVAIPAVAAAGGLMGNVAALCVAPTAWLNSPDGRKRMHGFTSPTMFRLWAIRFLLVYVLLTLLLLGAAIGLR